MLIIAFDNVFLWVIKLKGYNVIVMINDKKSPWKIIETTDVSPSKWFPISKDIVQLPNGNIIDYYKSELANVAMVIPITKNNEVVFVKQYKHGIGKYVLEFPAGRIESSQTATQTAIRELLEETGILVGEKDLTFLIELWTEPSKSTVRVSGYLATGVTITQKQSLEETEAIKVVKVPLSNLSSFVAEQNIHASDTLALLGFVKEKGLI